MRNPRVMPELVGGLAPLPELLKEECRRRGAAPEEREAIAGMLPANLRAAPGFLDRLTARWRYDFGLPYENLRGGGTMIGTPMHPPVDKLLDVLVFIRSRLSPEKLAAYFHRLDQPGKHEDVLFECAPVLRLDPSMQVEHEAEGYGCEGATIDWAIGPQDAPILLLEVKTRRRDLMEHVGAVLVGERNQAGQAPEPSHSADLLFRSVEAKFRPANPRSPIQAVWVNAGVTQEEDQLRLAFGKLDPTKVHCALLGDWEQDVHALAQSGEIKAATLATLRAVESDRFVFRSAR